MNFVTYLPAAVATKLQTPANVIGIASPYDNSYTYAVHHKRLLSLVFFADQRGMSATMRDRLIQPEQCQRIIDFVNECKGEDIIVHCGEGRVRSPAVAQFIEFISVQQDEDTGWYYLKEKYPGCIGTVLGADRELFFRLRSYYDSVQRKAQE